MEVCAAPKGRAFAPFGRKTGNHFAHLGLESVREKEECGNSKWMLRNLF